MLCVPHITKNLLNISKITKDNQVVVEFHVDKCIIKDKHTQVVLLQGHLKDGLYQLSIPTSTTSQFHSKVNPTSSIQTCLSVDGHQSTVHQIYSHNSLNNSVFVCVNNIDLDSSKLSNVLVSNLFHFVNKKSYI